MPPQIYFCIAKKPQTQTQQNQTTIKKKLKPTQTNNNKKRNKKSTKSTHPQKRNSNIFLINQINAINADGDEGDRDALEDGDADVHLNSFLLTALNVPVWLSFSKAHTFPAGFWAFPSDEVVEGVGKAKNKRETSL